MDGPLAGQLLNAGFEATFYAPRAWIGVWLGEGGALSFIPNDQTDHVLFQYTGTSSNDIWVASYQNLPIAPGAAVRGAVFVRTQPGLPWVNGSRAFIRVHFLNEANLMLATYDGTALTGPNTNWPELTVTTGAAPPNAVFARLSLYLFKPQETNQSIQF